MNTKPKELCSLCSLAVGPCPWCVEALGMKAWELYKQWEAAQKMSEGK